MIICTHLKRIVFLVLVFFFHLVTFGHVYTNELRTLPSGIDVWDNQTYLGKTPLELQLNNDSNIYLFSDIKADVTNIYNIVKLDRSLFSSDADVYIDSPYCDNYLTSCDDRSVDLRNNRKGFFPFFYLNHNERNFYSLYTDPPYYKFDIFDSIVSDDYPYLNRIQRLFFSPDSRYIAFFEESDPIEEDHREIHIYKILTINSETKLPTFEKIPTHHVRDSFSSSTEIATFSPNSRWFSFCVTDLDSNCHFSLIDLNNPTGAFIPVGGDQIFDSCIWQKSGTKLACKQDSKFFIYDVSDIDNQPTNITFEKQFEITAVPSNNQFEDDDFFFAGDSLIWRWRGSLPFGNRGEEFAIYNLQTDTVDKVFRDSRLSMITEDGRFIAAVANNLEYALKQFDIHADEKQQLIENNQTYAFELESTVFYIFDTNTKTTISKILHSDKKKNFRLHGYQKEYFYQSKYEAFANFLLNYPKDIVYPMDLFSSLPSDVISDLSSWHSSIDIVDDTLRISRGLKLNSSDPETENNLLYLLNHYGYRSKRDREDARITFIFSIGGKE